MKVKLITAFFAVVLLCAAMFYTQMQVPKTMTPVATEVASQTAAPFPDVTFKIAEGKDLSIRDLHEKTILVHFWAAWCAVCYTEFPDLVKYVEKSNGDVALISVSLDDNYSDSQKALNKIAAKNHLQLRLPHLYWAWDQNKDLSLKTFNTVKVPETIVVNENRQMVDKVVGVGTWLGTTSPLQKP